MSKAKDSDSYDSDFGDPDFDDDKTANLNANNLAKIGGKPAAATQPQPISSKPGSNVPPPSLNKPGALVISHLQLLQSRCLRLNRSLRLKLLRPNHRPHLLKENSLLTHWVPKISLKILNWALNFRQIRKILSRMQLTIQKIPAKNDANKIQNSASPSKQAPQPSAGTNVSPSKQVPQPSASASQQPAQNQKVDKGKTGLNAPGKPTTSIQNPVQQPASPAKSNAQNAQAKPAAQIPPVNQNAQTKPAAQNQPAAQNTQTKPAAQNPPANQNAQTKPAAQNQPAAQNTQTKPAAQNQPPDSKVPVQQTQPSSNAQSQSTNQSKVPTQQQPASNQTKVPPQQPVTNQTKVPSTQTPASQKPAAQQMPTDPKVDPKKPGAQPASSDKTQPIPSQKGPATSDPKKPDGQKPQADASKKPVIEPPKSQPQAQQPPVSKEKNPKQPSKTDPVKDQKPQQPPANQVPQKPAQSGPTTDKKAETQPKDPKKDKPSTGDLKVPGKQDAPGHQRNLSQTQADTNNKIDKIDPNSSQPSIKSILTPSKQDQLSNKDASLKKEVKFQGDDKQQSPQKAPPGPATQSPEKKDAKQTKPGEEVANKYSLNASDQNIRLKQWHQNMKAFKLFNDAKLPGPAYDDTKLFGISLSEMNPPFKMPDNSKFKDPKYLVDFQANCTLCDPSIGLYGRTVVCRSGEPVKPDDLKMQQWLLFMSDLKINKTFLLCEIIINIYDKDELKVPVSNIVIGVAAVRILQENTMATIGKNQKIPIHITTPRLFVIFDEGQTIENKLSKVKTSEKGYKIMVDVHEFKDKGSHIQDMKKFLQKNCIVGTNDIVPGFKGNHIPPVLADDCLKSVEFDMKSKVWAHKIKIDGLDQIDSVFQKYLKQSVKTSGYRADILSRKLTVTSSNSCFLMNQSQTSINLKISKESKKLEQPEEVLHIPNLVANNLTCLVFRVSYKVKYILQTADGQKQEVVRDFVLGRHPFFMNFDQVGSGMIKDRLVQFDLTMCPELNIIKDLMWDPNQSSNQAVDLKIKLQMFLSNFEDLKTEEQQNQMQDDLQVKMLEMEKKKQLEKSGIDVSAVGGGGAPSEEYIKKLTETEAALRKTQIDYQRLQKEMEKAKDRQTQSKMSQMNIGLDDNKVKTKPVDVPIPAVDISTANQNAHMPDIKTPPNKMLQILIEREDNDVKQLTELLQRLLDQTKGNQDVYSDVIARLEGQIIRMLESDPQSQMTMFGTTGRFKALQFNNLPDKDKRAILQESSRGAQKKGPSMAPEMLDITKFQIKPKMNLELNDFLKATEISIKFLVFKTPISMNRDIRMPKKVYFTTKFFTQRKSETGLVFLRLEKSVAADLQKQQAKERREAMDSNANPEGQLMANQQYFLMRQKNLEDGKSKQKMVKTALDAEYEAYKNDLQLKFDFDPSLDAENQKAEDEQHRIFSEYLYSRTLTIDIWDGDSMMHFGSCKIPLMLIMRQGQAKITVGQEFDVVDPIYTQRVGGLQLVIENQGRQIHRGGKAADAGYSQPSKTITKSVPMEPAQIQKTLKQQIQESQNQVDLTTLSEDEKKKLRLQRIKQRQIAAGMNPAKGLIADGKDESAIKTANRVQKQQELQMVNELRKKTKMDLFQKLGATAKSNDIITMQVMSGQLGFQEVTVKNPYDSAHTFDIKITDADFNDGKIQFPEFQLVDGEEWKFWYEQGKCEQQQNYHFVDAKNSKMKLDAGKQVKILFKFLSLREPIVDHGKKQKEEPAGVISHELRPRSIKVEIFFKDQAVQSEFIDIKPREMICDQVFRYYLPMQQPENPVLSTIKVPNIVINQGPFEKDLIPLNQLTIVCSNQEFKFEKTEDDGITYQVKCGKSMSVTTGFIYIYKDKKQSELLGACKVEVHSCVYIQCQNVQAGVKFDINLQITNPIQKDASKQEMMKRKVELFSSNTQLVFAQNGRRSLHLLKEHRQAIQSMPISVRTMNMDKNSARVTAVDIDTKEIIQQYLIEVQATKPKVKDVKVIECPVGQEMPYFFDWTNPVSTHKMVFSIASNNSNLIKPEKGQMEFNVGEKKNLRFFVPPQAKAGTFEAQIVINTQQPDLGTNDQSKPQQPNDAIKLPEHSETVLVQIVVK